ncbi:MAG TPA: adenylate/guanylate cyclase domain-containing protein, partial [Candidatus Binataceae bacterium]|nr:adenylate/guanylate cyclase domain-containing protein [Candidatus Binataceae bacterium]
MRCPKCGVESPPGKKFCAECGSPLVARCAKCGAETAPSAKFCADCGASLASVAADQPESPKSSERVGSDDARITIDTSTRGERIPEGEKKTVTALFADIKGSMDLMEDLDPEQARALVDPALELMIEATHRYDGYVVQSTGDGVFALFGAPTAREDHAHRALYAALRMQDEMRRYSARLREQGSSPIEIRIGVNTGEVVVRSIRTDDRHVEYTPIGHATSLAARMQALAPTGAIAITENTYRLVAGFFEMHPLGPARVKGVTEPVNVYEVAGIGPLRTRLQRSASRGLSHFIGREHEIAELKRALHSARGGHGQIVAAVADPGIGKSRLFYEFKQMAPSDTVVLEAVSVSHGRATAYLPVIELLKNYFRIGDRDDERLKREKMTGKLLALDRALEDTLPFLFAMFALPYSDSTLAEMDAQIRRRRTREAVKRILLRESLNQPLILIF